jgi:hypothetical protein
MKKLLVATIGLLCLICTSCTKENLPINEDSLWYGEYESRIMNETTGVVEDHTAWISLNFYHADGDLVAGYYCKVATGFIGLMHGSQQTFEARWTGKDSFDLYPITGEQILKRYSGSVNRNKMTLHTYSGGAIEATYSLNKSVKN